MDDLSPDRVEFALALLEWSRSLDREEDVNEPAAGDLVVPEDRLLERV